MKFKEKFKNSPNQSGVLKPKGIILHDTAGSYVGSVAWCANPASKVSYHCIVNVDGERTTLVGDTSRAWHAGKSSFKGVNFCNSFMLGIAVSGSTKTRNLTNEETQSVAEWCIGKMRAYGFGIDMITTHANVSPGRKIDVSVKAYNEIIERIKSLMK